MGLSSSTQAKLNEKDKKDPYSAIVNPKKDKGVPALASEEDDHADAFATPMQTAIKAANAASGGGNIVLDSRASIIKRVNFKRLWENFIKGNYLSFALTQSEVKSLLSKSCSNENDSTEMKAITEKDIDSYVELVDEMSQSERKESGNPMKVIDFMALCGSAMLLSDNTVDSKAETLFDWITMDLNADHFTFIQFLVALRSYERGISHALGYNSYSEESIRGVAKDWFALADPEHKGFSNKDCKISRDEFRGFCCNRQHVVRRLLEGLSFSMARVDENRNIQEVVVTASNSALSGGPSAGDEWMSNPAWKKTAERMVPEGHEHKNTKPSSTLQLEWVHGYRGFDCRNNLHYVDATGEQFFFHAAGLGIVQSCAEGNRSQYFFGEHSDDVISLDSRPVESDSDCRILATGEIGKHPAVCLYEWNAKTKQFLSLASMRGFHEGGVYQVAFSYDTKQLFTVGSNYTIAVYDTDQQSKTFGNMLCSSQGPKDKILHCASLPDGSFVSCGEKHISSWKTIRNRMQQTQVKLGSHKRKLMMCVTYLGRNVEGEACCAVGTSAGDILIVGGGVIVDQLCVFSGDKSHRKSVNCVWANEEGTLMITGDTTGKVIIWAIDTVNPAKGILTQRGHFYTTASCFGRNELKQRDAKSRKPPVRSVCISNDLKKCVVGTQACEVIEYTLKSSGTFGTSACNESDLNSSIQLCGHYKEEVWGLAIRPRGRLDDIEGSSSHPLEYCTVGDDGILRVWDLKSHTQKDFLDMGGAARCCAYSPDGQYLAVGFGGSITGRRSKTNGRVRIYRGDTLQQVCEMKDAKQWISVIKFSPDGQVLGVGARDNSLYMYSVAQQFKRKSKFSKHNAGILDFDFTTDGKYVQSTCSAYELLFSSTSTGAQLNNGATFLADEKWATQTCTLGWPVIGVWCGGMDGSDVNSVDRSPSGDMIATGDDFGKVNCYKFPCTLPGGAPKNSYSGHSSHVSSVRWVNESKHGEKKTDNYLISLGGGDKTVMQWKVNAGEDSYGAPVTAPSIIDDDESADNATNPLGDGPSGGDEFMAVKPWVGAIREPSAWETIDESKKAPFHAALGEMSKSHRSLREISEKEVTIKKAEDRSLAELRRVYSEVMSSASNVMSKMSVSGESNSSQPDGDELDLEWVHGFAAGFNNRNAVHYIDGDTSKRYVVYAAAGLGVLAEISVTGEIKQRYFRGHTDDITSLAKRSFTEGNEKKTMIATGQIGKGNTYIWEVPSMKTLAILKTGQKTISLLEFSKADGGRILVSISADCSVCLSDWKSQTVIAKVRDNSVGSAYHLCSSQLSKNFSFLLTGDQYVSLWSLHGRNLSSNKVRSRP